MADLQADVSVLQPEDCSGLRSCLRKLWLQARSVEGMSKRVARQMLYPARARPLPHLSLVDLDDVLVDEDDEVDKNRFKAARSGEYLMIPFQCDRCHFVNIKKREPEKIQKLVDKTLIVGIRRANLDSFWYRETTTVEGNADKGQRMLRIAES
jgi:hypothetical protein